MQDPEKKPVADTSSHSAPDSALEKTPKFASFKAMKAPSAPGVETNNKFVVPRQLHRHGSKIEELFDKWGIWLSGICMVHCIVTPILLLLLPMMTFIESEWVHIALACILPVLAFGAFIPGVRRHRDFVVIELGLIGLALIIFAALDPFHWLNTVTEGAVTSAGSLTLIAAHLRNRRGNQCEIHGHHHY